MKITGHLAREFVANQTLASGETLSMRFAATELQLRGRALDILLTRAESAIVARAVLDNLPTSTVAMSTTALSDIARPISEPVALPIASTSQQPADVVKMKRGYWQPYDLAFTEAALRENFSYVYIAARLRHKRTPAAVAMKHWRGELKGVPDYEAYKTALPHKEDDGGNPPVVKLDTDAPLERPESAADPVEDRAAEVVKAPEAPPVALPSYVDEALNALLAEVSAEASARSTRSQIAVPAEIAAIQALEVLDGAADNPYKYARTDWTLDLRKQAGARLRAGQLYPEISRALRCNEYGLEIQHARDELPGAPDFQYSKRGWRDAEVALVDRLLGYGLNYRAIAQCISRSYGAVEEMHKRNFFHKILRPYREDQHAYLSGPTSAVAERLQAQHDAESLKTLVGCLLHDGIDAHAASIVTGMPESQVLQLLRDDSF
jgi:hypothetical protein